METTKTLNIDIRPAQPQECDKVALLLKTVDLAIHDIDSCLDGFLVAYDGDRLVGTVGIETYGETGLLRSLAVDIEYRNQKIGEHLYERALDLARSRNIRRLYLLTITAAEYFSRRGFREIPRDKVPAAIQRTEQFSSICPDSATVMQRNLQD